MPAATGWAVEKLGSLLQEPPKYGIGAAASPYAPDAPTYIRITDITEDGRFVPQPRVSVRHPLSGNYYLHDGDLVFARTGASTGKSYRYDPNAGPLVYAGFLIRIRPDEAKLLPSYLSYYVQTKPYWDWVRVMSVRSGQPGINGAEYARMPVHLPPLPVQRTIAEALGEADAAIARVRLLISKRRDIATAVGQQLLGGSTRLPGFVDAWTQRKIGSLGTTYGGLTGKSKQHFERGGRPFVPFMSVMAGVRVSADDDLPLVDVADNEKQNEVRPDDLLFNSSSETADELAMCAVVGDMPPRTYLNSFCFGLRLNSLDETDPVFLAYLFRSGVGRKLLYPLAQGYVRYNLSRRQFRELFVTLPHVDEQRLIGAALADLDAEIELLELKLAKLSDIKVGMIQTLCSGAVELPTREPKS